MEFLRLLPKNMLSRAVGDLAAIESPKAVATTARDWFIKRYNINMAEAEHPLEAYPSISKLFTRKLKSGLRPIGEGVVHPCDGALSCADIIDDDTLIQAKGKNYSLGKLLVNEAASDVYSGGMHIVYYLCPTDYHRVHAPIDGDITKVTHVPGQLWPVNEWSVQNINELFSVNERVIFHIETALGPVELVMVGATNVGKITVSFDKEFVTNRAGQSSVPFEKTYAYPIQIAKGDELGIFNMGSTVVLIYPKDMLSMLPQKKKVKLGESV